MADDAPRPIIIKKIKKGGHGHHGGAWKVAYADFVTAMMAFFLLLWLLSSVDKSKLEGLAEYFTPTVGTRDSMGIGFEGGLTADEKGTKKEKLSKPGLVPGQVPQGPTPESPKDTLMEGEKDAQLFEKAEESMKKAFESDPNLRDLSDNIIVEQSPEGLKIEIMDSDKHPMFNPGSSVLTSFGQQILSKMLNVINAMPNFISITGHTDATPFGKSLDYSNWELSSDRANAARRFLLRAGMDVERPKKVVGQAAAELLVPDDPKSSKNRRITVILLRGAYMDLHPSDVPASRDLLSVPNGKPLSSPPATPAKETPSAPAPNVSPVQQNPAVGDQPVDAIESGKPSRTLPASPPLPGLAPPKTKAKPDDVVTEGFVDP